MDYVPFPTFSSENLPIWFAQMEATFTLNGVTSESDKYDYVINQIPANSMKIVEDIVMSPPSDDKYEKIKYEFIKRMAVHKLKQVKFGNEKPSVFLNKLKQVAGRRVPHEIILDVWANNLPEKVREIIRFESTGNMDRLSEMADKAMVLVTPNPPPQLVQGLSGYQFGMIMNRLDDLFKRVKMVHMMVDSDYEDDDEEQEVSEQQPSSQQQCSSQQSFAQDNVPNMNVNCPPNVICWYHTTFGDKAIACVAPCHYKMFATQYYLPK